MASVKKKKPKLKIAFEWRLPVVMAERRIFKKSDLHKLLTETGLEISSVHVGRIFKELPDLLNTDLLLALMQVLDCNLDDLIRVKPVEMSSEDTESTPEPAVKNVVGRVAKKTEKVETVPQSSKVVKRTQKGGLTLIETDYDPEVGPRFGAKRNLRKEELDKHNE